MDGYAVAAEALAGDGPFVLRVHGESRTGRPSAPLAPGTACRISTGAEIPAGATAVLPREDVALDGEEPAASIRFTHRPRSGQHVRRASEDLDAGALAVEAGTRLGAAHLGLLASLDVTEVVVARRPRVTILCTGDELRPAGTAHVPGKIAESNSLPLKALATLAGARARVAPYVADEREPTARAVAAALEDTDLLLTVGGVSVGDHDWVRPALEAAGVAVDFWKVAIKPGKPLVFGRHRDGARAVLGLPGNPASALVTFMCFGMPFLRAMQGDRAAVAATAHLPLAAPFRHKTGRLELVRARIEHEGGPARVLPLTNQASGAHTSLAWADALAFVPGDVESLEAGELVGVLRLSDC
jgi:molybdopterin molybdotransferase